MATFPIVSNCNFASRDDSTGRAIHRARKAVEAGRVTDERLIEALENLEDVLTEHADSQYAEQMELCRAAEREVGAAWAAIKE